jgi:Zn-dependent protease/CBS domain-containing protein
MRWSFRLGVIRGVPIEVHWLFGGLVLWAALESWGRAVGWAATYFALTARASDLMLRTLAEGIGAVLGAVALLLLVFACVLVHEIAHTVQAQALGIPVRRIWILPFGGLAELSRIPDQPRDELRVAAAGPAANLGLALVFGALAQVWLLAGPQEAPAREAIRAALRAAPLHPLGLLLYLAFANFGLTLFNLLPAFPMDGARIARSTLALIFPRLTSTRIVAGLGWISGAALIGVGVLTPPLWGWGLSIGTVLFGVFLITAGGFEEMIEKTRMALRGIAARMAVRQPTWTVSPTDTVAEISSLLFSLSGQSALPVVVGARLVGILAQKDVAAALKNGNGGPYTVAHLMQTHFPYVRADEDLWRAQQLLSSTGVGALPVVEGEALQGVLTADDIRAARHKSPRGFKIEAPTFITQGDLIT